MPQISLMTHEDAQAIVTKLEGIKTGMENTPYAELQALATQTENNATQCAASAALAIAALNNFKPIELAAAVDTYYKAPSLFTCTKSSVTLPAGIVLNIGGGGYKNTNAVTLNTSSVGTSNDLYGHNVYIYACKPSDPQSVEPTFVLSMNSTAPTGYTAANSRKIGGFHCLCADVGARTYKDDLGQTQTHWLANYHRGDILPKSCWDLYHKPQDMSLGALAYEENCDMWFPIYLLSWDGSKLVSEFGGTIADGASSKKFHGQLFAYYLHKHNCRQPHQIEFQFAAAGSNEGTAIQGASDPGTTGGHVDTANVRMISNIGLEDCCGALYQWSEDIGFAGGSGWGNSLYDSAVDLDGNKGQTYGTVYRLGLGGGWAGSSYCGSRCAYCNAASSYVGADIGGRGAVEPLHRKAALSYLPA